MSYTDALALLEQAHGILHDMPDDTPGHLDILAKSLELRALIMRRAEVAGQLKDRAVMHIAETCHGRFGTGMSIPAAYEYAREVLDKVIGGLLR